MRCRVATPRNLTQRQRELLEEFAAAGDEQRAKAG
jgi:DnaJ-class molecular chaperone